jgi:Ni/Fe-hydrogenase 1 B-type cytochrome subunit
MEIQQPSKTHWSRGVRLVHWLDALVVLGLLGTVLLRKTFLSYRANGALIQEELAERNVPITLDAAKAIARVIRAPMWDWHYYLGFALAALLLYRLILFFGQGEREILATSFLGRDSTTKLKKRASRSVHVLYYLFVAVMVATGLALYFKEPLGLVESATRAMKEVHETLTWFFVAFVSLHLAGVVIAECTDEPGIVSAMIHGKRSSNANSGNADTN